MMRKVLLAAAVICLSAAVASGATIAPGQTRTVTGTVSAVEVSNGTIVVEAPVGAGSLTVGVTMDVEAVLLRGGTAVGLGDIMVGEKVTLTYTRRGDRLIGLKVQAR